jgi:hypothetical protein
MNKLLTSMVAFILFHDKERGICMVASSLWPNYEFAFLWLHLSLSHGCFRFKFAS